MSERNMIINSSANSKHEHACTVGYEGLYVTAISQSRMRGLEKAGVRITRGFM